MSVNVDPDVMVREFCKAFVPEAEQDDAINALGELVSLLVLDKDTRDRLHSIKCRMNLRALDKRTGTTPLTKVTPR